jgi:hypothetical protein
MDNKDLEGNQEKKLFNKIL